MARIQKDDAVRAAEPVFPHYPRKYSGHQEQGGSASHVFLPSRIFNGFLRGLHGFDPL